ncbi:MAG: endonuclease/exonuclease/phosphatase family protein [Candidatus Margulisbacteria bacterium]|nr:endonuclease/exonuclease/phosphatase family protein [Candidatus Margulisiibacteriota bacterium]
MQKKIISCPYFSLASFNINSAIKVDRKSKNAGHEGLDSAKYIPEYTQSLANNLKFYNFDILCLQEVVSGPYNQAKALAEYLDYPYFSQFAMSDNHNVKGALMGNLTLSRYPILEEKGVLGYKPAVISMPEGWTVQDKGLLSTKIILPTGIININNVHLLSTYHFEFSSKEWKKMWSSLNQKLQKNTQQSVCIGDFNHSPEIIEKNIPQFRKVFNYIKTAETHYSHRTLDHLYVSSDIAVTDVKIIDNEYSDHFILAGELKIN